ALVRNLPAHPINREFGELPADAGEDIRQDLVAPYVGASAPQPSKASGQPTEREAGAGQVLPAPFSASRVAAFAPSSQGVRSPRDDGQLAERWIRGSVTQITDREVVSFVT
ncbi:hypothetical protein, partial [Streptomyces sp. NPDC046979]|uniref:hypothetical protein n=1 Tax=Streptomyces sp. NPDC046979 TaxID=3154604 RepID=UPI00340FC6FE